MELEANADYWGGRPKLDKIVLKPMPEPATRLAALQSGDVDLIEYVPWQSMAAIEADPNFRGGDYYDAEPGEGPWRGMSLARGIGQVSYR